MIREGSKSKKQYLNQRKADEKEEARTAGEDFSIKVLRQDRGQSRIPELAETLGGRSQTGGSSYGSGSGLAS